MPYHDSDDGNFSCIAMTFHNNVCHPIINDVLEITKNYTHNMETTTWCVWTKNRNTTLHVRAPVTSDEYCCVPQAKTVWRTYTSTWYQVYIFFKNTKNQHPSLHLHLPGTKHEGPVVKKFRIMIDSNLLRIDWSKTESPSWGEGNSINRNRGRLFWDRKTENEKTGFPLIVRAENPRARSVVVLFFVRCSEGKTRVFFAHSTNHRHESSL